MVVNELLFGFGTGSGAVRVSLDTCCLYHQNSCDSSPRSAALRPLVLPHCYAMENAQVVRLGFAFVPRDYPHSPSLTRRRYVRERDTESVLKWVGMWNQIARWPWEAPQSTSAVHLSLSCPQL